MKYGMELKAQILQSIESTKAQMAERQERLNNWETDEDDCFVSMRVDDNAMSNYKMQLDILDGDGTMDWEAIMDENGKEVNVRWVKTRYGGAYVGRGIFASSKKALCKKTGWRIETIKVPVWTKFFAAGSGIAGVYGGSYGITRWHTNMVTGEYVGYPAD